MRPCGYECIANSVISEAKKMFQKSDGDMNMFLQQLNNAGIGGGNLQLIDGRVIGTYDECYCGIPKAVKEMPAVYCECSAGWFEKFFAEILGHDVDVFVKGSILHKNSVCTFEIELNEQI